MEESSFLATVVLPISLAVIMCSLGLSLTLDDFKRVVTFPRGAALGVANLLLISPFLGFVVAEAFNLNPLLAVGLVLMAAAPGGTLANLLTHLARGDTALSVTMTAITSLAAVVTVPLYLKLSTDHFDADIGTEVGMLGIVAKVFLITIVPLSLGMYIRRRNEARVMAVEGRIRKVALGLFVLVVVAAVASEFEVLTENFADVAGAALALNVAAMTVSYTLSRLARLSNPQSTAIAIELGLHNSTLAITVGSALNAELAIPAAVYSGFMFITAGLFARVMHRRNAVPALT